MFQKLLNYLKNVKNSEKNSESNNLDEEENKVTDLREFIKFSTTDYEIKNYFWDGNKNDSGNKFLEAAIYDMFLKNISSEYLIIPHVSLREIFVPTKEKTQYFYLAFLAAHHVDFLILDRISAKPIMAIEICGSYHQESEQQKKSDQFKLALFKQVRIPIFFIGLDKDVLDKKFYNSLFEKCRMIIPVYHKPCNSRMFFVKEGKHGSYYRCPKCINQFGKSQLVSLKEIPDILL